MKIIPKEYEFYVKPNVDGKFKKMKITGIILKPTLKERLLSMFSFKPKSPKGKITWQIVEGK